MATEQIEKLMKQFDELERQAPNTAIDVMDNVIASLGLEERWNYEENTPRILELAIPQLANLIDAGEAS